MINRSGVVFKENVHLQLFNKDGNLLQDVWAHNLVPTVGLAHIADRLSSSPGDSAMSHMAVGTSSSAPAAGNTILGGEVGRVALTSITDAGGVVTYIATFGAGTGTGALQEAGIFNSATTDAGTLLCRVTYSVINKGASDIVVVTWTLTPSDDGV